MYGGGGGLERFKRFWLFIFYIIHLFLVFSPPVYKTWILFTRVITSKPTKPHVLWKSSMMMTIKILCRLSDDFKFDSNHMVRCDYQCTLWWRRPADNYFLILQYYNKRVRYKHVLIETCWVELSTIVISPRRHEIVCKKI